MNVKVKADVFYLENEYDVAQQNVGVTVDLSNCVLKSYSFYNIDFITEHTDKRFSIVCSGGVDFIVNETRESLEKRIDALMMYPFN